LYRMTVNYLRDVKGVHNILYAFSPCNISTEDEFLLRFPGDDYVDIVGVDAYCGNTNTDESNAKFKKEVSMQLDIVTGYAKKTNKIPVLAETGMEGIENPDFFTKVLLPAIEPYQISYVLLWRNAYTIKTHYYAPFPGHASAGDFKKFTDMPGILLSKKISPMYVSEK
jgi:beta-mannanase